MRLFDWILGRGRNPLEAPSSNEAMATTVGASSEPARAEDADSVATPEDVDDAQFAAEVEELLEQQARAVGVDVPTYVEMVHQREHFLGKVEAEPRVWGFDLSPPDSPVRRDVVAEYRRATRLTGTLGESFLVSYEPLMALVPDPLTMDEHETLPDRLHDWGGLSPGAAAHVAKHIRTTIQATLGKPLEADAVEHAVREAAWDHDFDAAAAIPKVLEALERVL